MKHAKSFKVILRIMLVVFAADFAAATYLMRSWLAALLLGATMYALYALRPRKVSQPPAVGWPLGPAIELTDPDKPLAVGAAFIGPSALNLGMLIIGGPGSGKTIATLSYIDSIKQWSPLSGWVYYEGKGDTDIYKKLVAMGSKPNHFFSSELPGSDTINLFEGRSYDVIDNLSKWLIGKTASTTFFSDEQRKALSMVVPLLRALPVATNLRDLFVALSIEDAGNELLRRARDAGVDAVSLEMARQWYAVPAMKRLENISGLINRLFVFVAGEYADRLNAYQPDIRIADAVGRNETIYLHLPLSAFARDVAVAIIETFGVVAKSRQLAGAENATPFPQLFDDWGAFFHGDFGPYAARCRSAAMSLSFGFQSKAQMDDVTPTFTDIMDDNIASKIILRVQGVKTSEFAIALFGQYQKLELGTSDSSSERNSSSGHSMNFRPTDRLNERDLRTLLPGEGYVSTLQEVDGKMENPYWKLRIPMPNIEGWKKIEMPAAKVHAEGEGLGFWNRYMNPSALAEIHASVQAEAKAAEEAKEVSDAAAREAAMAELANNPGFGA